MEHEQHPYPDTHETYQLDDGRNYQLKHPTDITIGDVILEEQEDGTTDEWIVTLIDQDHDVLWVHEIDGGRGRLPILPGSLTPVLEAS